MEDPLLQEVAVELARDAVNQNSEGEKAKIAVGPLRSGLVGKRKALDELHEFVLGPVLSKIEFLRIVAKARGVAKQLAYGDVVPSLWRVFKILAERILEADLSLYHEHHHGRGSELLADGARLKDGLGLGRHLQFHVGQSESFGENNLSTLRN